MEDTTLHIGDKVCRLILGGDYIHGEVTRVTKLYAFVNNSIKLKRTSDYGSTYDEIGSHQYRFWKRVTPQFLQEEQLLKEKKTIKDFWHNFKPTPEQMEEIYQKYGKGG